MRLVAGEDFVMAGTILSALMFGMLAIYLGITFGHVIVAINKQKQAIWIYVITAVTSLAGYLILIPRYSFWGAAGVTIYSEILVMVLTFGLVYYYTKVVPSFNKFLKAILASLVMGVVLWALGGYNLLILILLGGAIYFIVLYLLKGFSKEMVREILMVKGKSAARSISKR